MSNEINFIEIYNLVTADQNRIQDEGQAIKFVDDTWALRLSRKVNGVHVGWDLSMHQTQPDLPLSYIWLPLYRHHYTASSEIASILEATLGSELSFMARVQEAIVQREGTLF